MDLSKIIEYQTLDSKLFKIERELKNNSQSNASKHERCTDKNIEA